MKPALAHIRLLLVPAALAAAVTFALVASSPALAANGDCGQPVSSGTGPSALDCSYVLKASVGSKPCELCVCDINGNASTTTTDALMCLKKAVGQNITLACPSCGGTTTTTVIEQPSTTSTSTTSTTTTMPVRCTDNSGCSALPDPFRCNPNTGTCEKPCSKNTDCKDFYTCNTTTHYCQDPGLMF